MAEDPSSFAGRPARRLSSFLPIMAWACSICVPTLYTPSWLPWLRLTIFVVVVYVLIIGTELLAAHVVIP